MKKCQMPQHGVCSICRIVCKFMHVLIAFLVALQWKHSDLLGTKQAKFTETSTPKESNFSLLHSGKNHTTRPSRHLTAIIFEIMHNIQCGNHFDVLNRSRTNSVVTELVTVHSIRTIYAVVWRARRYFCKVIRVKVRIQPYRHKAHL